MTFQLKARKCITGGYCTLCTEPSPSFLRATKTSLLKSLRIWQKEFASALRVFSPGCSKQAFHSETCLYWNHHVATQMNWRSTCYTCNGRHWSIKVILQTWDFLATWPTKFLLAHLPLVAKKWPVFLLCVYTPYFLVTFDGKQLFHEPQL